MGKLSLFPLAESNIDDRLTLDRGKVYGSVKFRMKGNLHACCSHSCHVLGDNFMLYRSATPESGIVHPNVSYYDFRAPGPSNAPDFILL